MTVLAQLTKWNGLAGRAYNKAKRQPQRIYKDFFM
jgi:hypothetical protein